MLNGTNPSTSMFDGATGENIKGSELINGGQNTTVNKTYNFNIGGENLVLEFKVPDIIGYIAKPLVALIRANQSTSADGRERDAEEISSLMARGPSPLHVLSIADRYTRSLLECLVGYPLFEPKPFSELSMEYLHNGVNIGDVGFVREDGAFDFLFNIYPNENSSILPKLLDGFCLPEHSRTRRTRLLSPKTCFSPPPIMETESDEYICKGLEGAMLVLPEGAIEEETLNKGRFEELAKLRGVEWYGYTKALGRGISNGSLYLVTSFTKSTEWGIAVFDRPCDAGQGLTFVASNNSYAWKGPSVFTTKVANSNQGRTPNQCVFLRGYKVMIRQDIFDSLGTAQRIRGGGGSQGTNRFSSLLHRRKPSTQTTISTTNGSIMKESTMKESDEVVSNANFNSSPVHPSDFINAALLDQNPDAKVALTHDDVWCDLFRNNFPEPSCENLMIIARSYTSTVDKNGCVSLEKISISNNVLDESSRPVRGTETTALEEPVQDVRDERDSDISAPAQASTTHQLQVSGHISVAGDDVNSINSVSSQAQRREKKREKKSSTGSSFESLHHQESHALNQKRTSLTSRIFTSIRGRRSNLGGEEELRQTADEATVKELKRREREIHCREAEAKQMELEAKRQVLGVTFMEEEARRMKGEARLWKEEMKKTKKEIERREEEALYLAEEMRQKAGEIKKRVEELATREEELERQELESRLEGERQEIACLQKELLLREHERQLQFKQYHLSLLLLLPLVFLHFLGCTQFILTNSTGVLRSQVVFIPCPLSPPPLLRPKSPRLPRLPPPSPRLPSLPPLLRPKPPRLPPPLPLPRPEPPLSPSPSLFQYCNCTHTIDLQRECDQRH